MDLTYTVHGGVPLRGDVTIGGSKNAVLPLLAASVLAKGETVFTNVPDLSDVRAMLKILDFLGAQTSFNNNTVRVNADALQSKPIPDELVCRLRGSIVLLGPLLARFGVVEMGYPGGCVLGKRPVGAHIEALTQLGAEDTSTDSVLHLQGTLKAGHVILPEFSVTATENAVLAAALLPGVTQIELAAAEPHVQDVCNFVQKMGARIDGISSHTLVVHGNASLHGAPHKVVSDYLESGAFILAGIVTRGKLSIHEADHAHLHIMIETLRRAGASIVIEKNGDIIVDGEASVLKPMSVRTNIFPGFPTDLQAPMGVAMTQAQGVSRIFERLFEGRLGYLYELEKMGAHVEILNSHQALIIGPTQLQGRTVASNDIRAGVAMVLAALCAEGKTVITDIRYIERGYDRLDEKLRSLGAKIEKSDAAASQAHTSRH